MLGVMRTSAANALQLIRRTEEDVTQDSGDNSDADSQGASDLSEVSTISPGRKRRPTRTLSGRKTRVLHRWTSEEHRALQQLVRKYGTERNWSTIAQSIPGRTGKQCRERWLNHLRDGIVKGNWTADEEFTLSICHALVGSHWSKMARRLPGRTENSIKNFWNATYRSKAASKKRGMLWNYIAATRTTQDRERAFINAAVQLATDGDFPPSILVRLPPKPASASPQEWRDLFEAEAAALHGSDDGEDTSCAPISTPTPTRPRMPSVRGPRGGASGLTPAMAAAALAVIKPSTSAASPVLSLSSPVVSRGSVMSRGSYEQSTTVEHERSSTSSDHGASEESAHHHGLQGMPMRSMHSHSYSWSGHSSPHLPNNFGAVSTYTPQPTPLASPHQPQPHLQYQPQQHHLQAHHQHMLAMLQPASLAHNHSEPAMHGSMTSLMMSSSHHSYRVPAPLPTHHSQPVLHQQPFQQQQHPFQQQQQRVHGLPPRAAMPQASPFQQLANTPLRPVTPPSHHHMAGAAPPVSPGQLHPSGRLHSRPNSMNSIHQSGVLPSASMELNHAHTAPLPGNHPHGPHGGHLGFTSAAPSAIPGELDALLPSVAELAAFEGSLPQPHALHSSMHGELGTADMGAMMDEIFGVNPAASMDALLHEEDFFATVERALASHCAEVDAAAAAAASASNGTSVAGIGYGSLDGSSCVASADARSMGAGSHFASYNATAAASHHLVNGQSGHSPFGSHSPAVTASPFTSNDGTAAGSSHVISNDGTMGASSCHFSVQLHSNDGSYGSSARPPLHHTQQAPVSMLSAEPGAFVDMLGSLLGEPL